MKIHVIATVAVVAAHLTLAGVWPPSFRLLVDCGAMSSPANDIADAPRLGLVGAIIVGLGWIALANGLLRWWRLSTPPHER